MQGKATVRSAVRRCVAIAGIVAIAPLLAAGEEYVMRSSVVANGGGVVSSGCYTLVSTIGQPVAGEVATGGASYRLVSGFLAEPVVLGDTIFRNGFEHQTGDCTP